MTVVVDASVAAEMFLGASAGDWAAEVMTSTDLAVPPHFHLEVASVLRRAALAGAVSDDLAALAHADLTRLRVRVFGYDLLADRSWELRDTLTPYDGTYVALAEMLAAPLATLDRRLARSPGPRCAILTP